MLGTSVGNYEIVAQLGVGGMGAVYLAQHAMLGRKAAVKVLLPELSGEREIVERFFDEARATTALKHPSIVEVYDFGFLPQGNAYLIMELLEGECLGRRLHREGTLPLPTALLLTRQIAGALAAAHARQIVHRDLKPDNLYLVADPEIPGGERIKLLDFGIAKLVDEQSCRRTLEGDVVGTPTYMAPEQCRGDVNVDHRADLYALGCILYELLCGAPPFCAASDVEVMRRHLYFPPPLPSHATPGIPAGVDELVLWLLRKSAAERPASAAEVIAALAKLGCAAGSTEAIVPTSAADGVATRPNLRRVTPAPASPPTRRLTTLTRASSERPSQRTQPRTAAPIAASWLTAAGGVLLLGGGLWLWRDRTTALDDAPPATAFTATAKGTSVALPALPAAPMPPALPIQSGAPAPSVAPAHAASAAPFAPAAPATPGARVEPPPEPSPLPSPPTIAAEAPQSPPPRRTQAQRLRRAAMESPRDQDSGLNPFD